MSNRPSSSPCNIRVIISNATDIGVLLLIPVFLCFVVRDWIFTQVGTIDPYIYLGYFRNLNHYFAFFGTTYYGARLPFIIPGYICYKIFPPLLANYVLHLGFYYLALFSLYFILRIAVHRRAALFTAIIMGFYPYFLTAVGWDYIDGAAIAYLLLTILLLTMAAKSPHANGIPNPNKNDAPTLSKKRGLLLFLAGISFAALIYTTTFMLIMIPSLVLYYFVIRPQSWMPLLKSALLAGYGMIFATVLLGIISVVMGGTFLFFEPSILIAGYMLISSNPWLIPGYTWLLHIPFMVFPFFIVLTSLLFLIVSLTHIKSGRFSTNSLLQVARDNIFGLCHLLNFILMLILQLLGKPSFQIQYYSTYLLPTAFLAAGAQLAGPLSLLSKIKFKVTAAIILSLLMGSYVLYYHTPIRSLISCSDSVWYASIVLVAGAACLSISRNRRAVNAWLVGLALVFFTSTSITLTVTNCAYCACEQRQQNFLAVIKSDDVIRTYDSTGNLRFWYSATSPLGNLYTSIASTHLWGYRLINDKFPEVAEQDFPGRESLGGTVKIAHGTNIVILSDDKDVLLEANTALNPLGLQANLVGTEEIKQGSISFTMTFIRTEANQINQQ